MAWAQARDGLLLSNGSFKLAISISFWQLSNGIIADSFKLVISISVQLNNGSFKHRETFRMLLCP